MSKRVEQWQDVVKWVYSEGRPVEASDYSYTNVSMTTNAPCAHSYMALR